jgi:membrane associated rhomboid family serine protease
VLGAYLLLFPRAKVLSLVSFLFFFPLRLPAWVVLGFYFVLQAVYAYGVGMAGGGAVAYLVHVVGFALGVGVVLALGRRLRPPPPPPRASWAY